MKHELDSADKKILELLQQDGRMTNAELARRVGLSPPSMLQRVRKLESKKLITGYSADVNTVKLGYGIVVIAMISLAMHQDEPIDEFIRAVEKIPEIIECHHISGEFDFVLKVVATDMLAYEKFIRENLSRVRPVGKIHSCFVLSTTKSASIIPAPK